MNSITQWKKHINNIASQLTREQLLMSEPYDELSQAQCDAMTAGIGRIINENIYDTSPDGGTAFSSGGYIQINCGYEVIENEKDDEKALLLLTGLRAHECGHELFTDFQTYMRFFDYLKNNKNLIKEQKIDLWKVRKPYKDNLIKMIESMEKYPLKNIIIQSTAKELENIFEDAYVNNGIYSYFSGEPSVGLKALNNATFSKEKAGTYEDALSKVANGEIYLYGLLMSIAHLIAIGHPYEVEGRKLSDDEKTIDTIINGFLKETKEAREKLPWETDSIKRCQYIAEVLATLSKFFPDQMPENQSQQGGQGQESQQSQGGNGQQKSQNQNGDSNQNGNQQNDGNDNGQDAKQDGNNSNSKNSNSSQGSNGQKQNSPEGKQSGQDGKDNQNSSSQNDNGIPDRDLTQEEADKIAKELLEMSKKHGKSTSSKGPMMKNPQLDKSKAERNQNQELSETQKRNLDKIAKSVAEQMAKQEMENQHSKDLQEQAQNIHNQMINSTGDTIVSRIYVNRERYQKYMKDLYKSIYKNVEKEATFITRRLKTILKDREVDEYERGFYSGQKVCVKDASKPGMKVFKKRNMPTGKPKIRVCVLVDESGSMNSQFAYRDNELLTRCDYVKEKAIMLNKVFSELEVEHCVIGHSAHCGDVYMNNYVDYNNVDGNDSYRLSEIHCSGSNADGMCIEQCCERLLEYEGKKLLIVLSDGLPSARGYESKNPVDDTIKAVAKYRKKGIEIIGTTLVPTNNQYYEIYGNQCIDCSTPEKFDKTFIKLISKVVLS